MEKLTFIQMSDIHFRKFSGDAYDVDNEVREAALLDLREQALQDLDRVDGILVCGDIAFSAQEEEYCTALEFLESVVDIVGLSLPDVYCVAGNHDVDQNVIKKSPTIQAAQQRIREADKDDSMQVDSVIREYKDDPGAGNTLFKALEKYNQKFAPMGSVYSYDKPYWQSEIPLGASKLIIHGMNSVLVSSHLDHIDENGEKSLGYERKMVVNHGQIPSIRNFDTVYLSMCHHPPESWGNPKLSQYMDARVKIQLYGHKHQQIIDSDPNRVRIYSGALQPEREWDGWKPQYNWIQIWLEGEVLCVDVYPRVFEKYSGVFLADKKVCDNNGICKHCEIKLTMDAMKTRSQENQKEICTGISVPLQDNVIRKIIFELYQLSAVQQNRLRNRYPQEKFDFSSNGIDQIVKWIQKTAIEQEFLNVLGEI